tara:strand:- start:633 stop:755 length:123 start_codon:yes stop_codon:yes gene_type:complete
MMKKKADQKMVVLKEVPQDKFWGCIVTVKTKQVIVNEKKL